MTHPASIGLQGLGHPAPRFPAKSYALCPHPLCAENQQGSALSSVSVTTAVKPRSNTQPNLLLPAVAGTPAPAPSCAGRDLGAPSHLLNPPLQTSAATRAPTTVKTRSNTVKPATASYCRHAHTTPQPPGTLTAPPASHRTPLRQISTAAGSAPPTPGSWAARRPSPSPARPLASPLLPRRHHHPHHHPLVQGAPRAPAHQLPDSRCCLSPRTP